MTVEDDVTRGELVEARDAARERRLSAAGLADDAERLTAPDLEADVVDRMHLGLAAAEQPVGLDREVLHDVLHLDEDVRARPGHGPLPACGSTRRAWSAGSQHAEAWPLPPTGTSGGCSVRQRSKT